MPSPGTDAANGALAGADAVRRVIVAYHGQMRYKELNEQERSGGGKDGRDRPRCRGNYWMRRMTRRFGSASRCCRARNRDSFGINAT